MPLGTGIWPIPASFNIQEQPEHETESAPLSSPKWNKVKHQVDIKNSYSRTSQTSRGLGWFLPRLLHSLPFQHNWCFVPWCAGLLPPMRQQLHGNGSRSSLWVYIRSGNQQWLCGQSPIWYHLSSYKPPSSMWIISQVMKQNTMPFYHAPPFRISLPARRKSKAEKWPSCAAELWWRFCVYLTLIKGTWEWTGINANKSTYMCILSIVHIYIYI